MLVPRRMRRRLLLPPGWVALGFLLLLGCQALQPWAGQLKQWNVMQITMPRMSIRLKPEEGQQYKKDYSMPYMALPELNKIRPWHDAEFKGELLSDFFNAATTESAIRKIIADTSHAGGVRIRFLPGATYANLVKVLDIMNYTNQKKYFLDIHHRPTTLYTCHEVGCGACPRPSLHDSPLIVQRRAGASPAPYFVFANQLARSIRNY